MPKYQIQYKNNSKTFTETLEAKSHIEIIDLFKSLINAELTEIREVVYTNNTYPKDDGDYIKSVSCLVKNKNQQFYSFKIPKMSKTISETQLQSLVKSYIKIGNKTPYSMKINQNF